MICCCDETDRGALLVDVCVRATPNKNIKFALITSTLRKTSLLTCTPAPLAAATAQRFRQSRLNRGMKLHALFLDLLICAGPDRQKWCLLVCVCTLHIPAGLLFLRPSLSRRPQLVASSSYSWRLLSRMSETDNLAARNFRHVIPLCADGRDVTLITPQPALHAHYNAEYVKMD